MSTCIAPYSVDFLTLIWKERKKEWKQIKLHKKNQNLTEHYKIMRLWGEMTTDDNVNETYLLFAFFFAHRFASHSFSILGATIYGRTVYTNFAQEMSKVTLAHINFGCLSVRKYRF